MVVTLNARPREGAKNKWPSGGVNKSAAAAGSDVEVEAGRDGRTDIALCAKKGLLLLDAAGAGADIRAEAAAPLKRTRGSGEEIKSLGILKSCRENRTEKKRLRNPAETKMSRQRLCKSYTGKAEREPARNGAASAEFGLLPARLNRGVISELAIGGALLAEAGHGAEPAANAVGAGARGCLAEEAVAALLGFLWIKRKRRTF